MELGARYHLERPLGRGGMGRVWLARHARSALPVAVKVLDDALPAAAVRGLQEELRHTAALDHPNVVPVLDQGVLDATDAARLGSRVGAPWIALGHVGGGDLERAAGTLGWEAARAGALQLLDALAHAHGRGVLHLDVKPANVLADGDRWLLADFGIARHLRDADGIRAGSPGFMAPEQLDPSLAPVGPWSDLFGLGCTLRRLLRAPEALPPAAADWLSGLLDPVPSRRLTAADARRTLLGAPSPAHPGPPAGAAPRPLPGAAPTVAGLPPGDAGDWRPSPLAPPGPIPIPDDWRTPEAPRPSRPPLALVGLRPLPAVGREDALDALWAALRAAAADRRPRVRVLAGPPAADAAAVGRAFFARAVEVGVHPAVHATLDPRGDVEPLAAVPARVRRPGADPFGALRPWAGERPWLLLVEGADRDPAGAAALAQEALASGGPLVLVLVAGPDVALPGERIALGPLERAAADALLRVHLGLGRRLAYALLERHGPWPGPLAAEVRSLWADERLVETFDGHELASGDVLADLAVTGALDEVLARARERAQAGDYGATEHLLAEHAAREPHPDRLAALARASLGARAAFALRRLDEADARARAAVALAVPGHREDDVAEALRVRGAIAYDQGRPAEGEALLREGIDRARTPNLRARVTYHLASGLLRRHRGADYREIRALYASGLPHAAGFPGLEADLRGQLAEVARLEGDFAEAGRQLDAAVGLVGPSGPLVNARAVLLRAEGRHEAAIAACREAVAAYGRAGRAPYHPLLCEGLSWWALGRPAEARAAFATGVERAAQGGRIAAEGALHAVSVAPALALGDVAGAAAHVARAEALLAGSGEADADVRDLLDAARALAADPGLAARIGRLADEQRALLAP